MNCNVIIEMKMGETNEKGNCAGCASRNEQALQTDLCSGGLSAPTLRGELCFTDFSGALRITRSNNSVLPMKLREGL